MLVCLGCFKPKVEKCRCNKPYIEIDDDIVEIIKILNEKGYITQYCCAGHVEREIFQCYIKFANKYNFKTRPKGFKLNDNSYTLENVVFQKRWNNKTKDQKEDYATKARYNLFKWAMNL